MKFKTSLLDLNKCRAAVRGAGLIALCALGTGLAQQASAGCLDVPGMKLPASGLLSASPFGAARFMQADYRQGGEDEYGPSFFHAPIVGLWSFKYTSKGNMATLGIPDGAPIDNGNTAWFADGNEITFSGARNPIVGASCIGVWKQTGERTYVLNHIGLSWNPMAPSNGLAGPGNPGGGPGASSGPAFIKQFVTLSRDGQSYTGTFSINQLMPDGKTPALPAPIKGTLTATRVTVDTTTQE
ncbi:MAG TPA: hypothetical protein VHW71_07005 [Steroidobacteraceae bacterium]|jgi:hypothetical protein|nr:hypothetical protein [Steroidobacteraceae bacterium]